MAAADFVKALTLVEYTQTLSAGTMERAFMETFIRESDVMAAMPMLPAEQGKHTYFQEEELPTVRNRAYNEDGNVSQGRTSKQEEGIFLMDEYIKVDRAMVDNFGESKRDEQEAMKQKAMARNYSRLIIKGDNSTEPREPNGLQVRSATAEQTTVVNAAASGGGPLSLAKLDQAISETRNPTHIIADRLLKPLLAGAARSPTLTNTMFGMSDDPLGRKVSTYDGLPILFGYEKSRDASLVPFSEVASGGGAAVTSSIYVVSFAADGVYGIEGTPLTVMDEGMLPGVPLLSTHVKWDFGLVAREYAITRLSSITNAAIAA